MISVKAEFSVEHILPKVGKNWKIVTFKVQVQSFAEIITMIHEQTQR